MQVKHRNWCDITSRSWVSGTGARQGTPLTTNTNALLKLVEDLFGVQQEKNITGGHILRRHRQGNQGVLSTKLFRKNQLSGPLTIRQLMFLLLINGWLPTVCLVVV